MQFTIFILCASFLLPREVIAFHFTLKLVKELLFPREPNVKIVRDHFSENRPFGNNLSVLDTVGLIEKHGYPAEEHNVTTDDGYNVILFRIPASPKSPPGLRKPVVFLQHGIIVSSDSWVLLGPKHDLAFLLADAGYDVWIGNIRGNYYGRSHTNLSPQDREFWNFSFHEVGIWDLPKMIDHALDNSGEKSLLYIGHSMGTTVAYIMLSERPEYNDKLRLVVSLAPVAIWKGPLDPILKLAVLNARAIKMVLDINGIYELGPHTDDTVGLCRALCSENSITQSACVAIYSMFTGQNPKQLNSSFLSHLLSYIPAGASTQTLEHYRQNIMSGTFEKFDYGYVQNFRLYGKKKPPIYDVKKISAPIALIYGKNDFLSTERNTAELVKRLQNVVTFEPVPYDLFNHADFLWGQNVKELLFNRIMNLMSNYSSLL